MYLVRMSGGIYGKPFELTIIAPDKSERSAPTQEEARRLNTVIFSVEK